jgi:hypothetical protein
MQTAKTKRNRRSWQTESELATVAASPPTAAEVSRRCNSTAAAVGIVRLGEGLHILEIGEALAPSNPIAGLLLPAIQVSAAPNNGASLVEVIGNEGYGEAWLGREGGTVVVRAPPGGGHVLVTAFTDSSQTALPPTVEVRRLARLESNGMGSELKGGGKEQAEIGSEIILHVEGLGDRSYPGGGWVGNRGRRLRIEAFSIRPAQPLAAHDIEFKALGPNGRETPWVGDAKLCGTRGQGLPLTGFAIRPAPHAGKRFDVVYYGAFFESGVTGPCRNGELCLPRIADDPLEAVSVQLIGRAAEPCIAVPESIQTLTRSATNRRRVSAATPRLRGSIE